MKIAVAAGMTLDLQEFLKTSGRRYSTRKLAERYEFSHTTMYEILLEFEDRKLVDKKPGREGGFKWIDKAK